MNAESRFSMLYQQFVSGKVSEGIKKENDARVLKSVIFEGIFRRHFSK